MPDFPTNAAVLDVRAVCASAGIPAEFPAVALGRERDFGAYITRSPALIITPRTVAELAQVQAALFSRGVPYKLRGTGHSSGGQTLIVGGVVVETRELASVRVEGDLVIAEAGARWLDIVRHVGPAHRPPILTDNLRTTIGGTLAVGGIGDRSIADGLQIAHVGSIDWVMPDGEQRTLLPSDELFGYVLGGRGQLGALARVAIPLIERPHLLHGFVAAWPSVEAFRDAVATWTERGRFEYVRAFVVWPLSGSARQRPYVRAFVGELSTVLAPDAKDILVATRPLTYAELPPSDRVAYAEIDPSAEWTYACPALELSLPLLAGLALWHEIEDELARSGLVATMPDGAAIGILRHDPRFPLAPVSAVAAQSLFVAIRPRLGDAAAARAHLPTLEAIANRVIDIGGRIYLMSIDPTREQLARQFGAAWDRLRTLKDSCDPDRLCNPGLV